MRENNVDNVIVNLCRYKEEMIRAEDTLFSRKPFREAATGAVEVYLSLHDNPLSNEAAAEEELLAGRCKLNSVLPHSLKATGFISNPYP
jgi:hypothetical protein